MDSGRCGPWRHRPRQRERAPALAARPSPWTAPRPAPGERATHQSSVDGVNASADLPADVPSDRDGGSDRHPPPAAEGAPRSARLLAGGGNGVERGTIGKRRVSGIRTPRRRYGRRGSTVSATQVCRDRASPTCSRSRARSTAGLRGRHAGSCRAIRSGSSNCHRGTRNRGRASPRSPRPSSCSPSCAPTMPCPTQSRSTRVCAGRRSNACAGETSISAGTG